MELIDNINHIMKDDLAKTIKPNSKVSIASMCFSIYAFQQLKNELEGIEELRFIFTSPAFVKERTSKTKREFYIPRLSREKSLYGTEYEIKLRNELTQRAIAKECTDWIRKKIRFKSNITNENIQGFISVSNNTDTICYNPVCGFTTTDLGCEKGNNSFNYVIKFAAPESRQYLQMFNNLWQDKDKLQDVTEQIIESISNVYKENSGEFIYFIALYNIFNEFLLKEKTVSDNLIREIDSVVPKYILFVFKYKDEIQIAISYKEKLASGDKFKILKIYRSEWQKEESVLLELNGLDLDTVFNGFISQISNGKIEINENTEIKQAVEKSVEIERLKRQIEQLKSKIRQEVQFNKQIELKNELKPLKYELGNLID